MEVYTLDSQLRREAVIDRFESLIWTERFNTVGDFDLQIRSTLENRNLLKVGTQLAMNQSYRVMTVETVEDGTDADGRDILKVKGPSLEAILKDRIARPSNGTLTAAPTWNMTLTPAAVARKIFDDICRTGILSTYDKIPYLVTGSQMPASNIPEPLDPIDVKLEPKSVYEALVEICNEWTLGFRLLRNFDASQLKFDVYSGNNLTTAQSTKPPVVFAPELDNLQNTTELNTIEGTKNVAYVIAPNGFQMVYPADVPATTAGFERRVLVVKADDITLSAGAALDAALLQRGKEELAKHRAFGAFDGEINQNSQYKYGLHYQLGDLVEMRNSDGVANEMRVIEQIFVSDKEGERAYPTLALNTFINTGSWLSWSGSKTWADYDADTTTVWATLP